MFLIFLMLLTTVGLSSTAGYFSIIGFSSFFSGSPIAAMVMAGVLEASKLVIISALHKYWKIMGLTIRTILIVPFIFLILITMSGVFGYLSKSHLAQTTPVAAVNLQIQNLDNQIALNKNQTSRYQDQLTTMDSIIQTQVLANRPTQANATREAQKPERADIKKSLDQDAVELANLQKKRLELDQAKASATADLGPLQALSKFLGFEADDSTISWLIMLLAPLFDMISLSLLITSQKAFSYRQAEKERIKNLPKPVVIPDPIPEPAPAISIEPEITQEIQPVVLDIPDQTEITESVLPPIMSRSINDLLTTMKENKKPLNYEKPAFWQPPETIATRLEPFLNPEPPQAIIEETIIEEPVIEIKENDVVILKENELIYEESELIEDPILEEEITKIEESNDVETIEEIEPEEVEEEFIEPEYTGPAILVRYDSKIDALIISRNGLTSASYIEEHDDGLIFHQDSEHHPHSITVIKYMETWHDKFDELIDKCAVLLGIDHDQLSKSFSRAQLYDYNSGKTNV